MEILQFYEGLPKDVTAREVMTMMQFPESLRGFGMVGRWQRAAKAQRWAALPKDVQQKHKEVPVSLRKCMKLNLKGRRHWTIHQQVEAEFDKFLGSRIHGLSEAKLGLPACARLQQRFPLSGKEQWTAYWPGETHSSQEWVSRTHTGGDAHAKRVAWLFEQASR
mmetsp:Transcript_9967/g.21898  ORF Transcript_9967/g.21898 Transcript_9967/m.21898 type:complete len:164 (-) Transcript_9967:55-546(-)